MPEIITAIYENGVLRPLKPLSLQEHQTVQIQVLPENGNELEQITHFLVATGLLTPPPRCTNVEPVSEVAWHELTEKLKATHSKPISEIIIEERGDW